MGVVATFLLGWLKDSARRAILHPNANDEYNPWNNPAPLRAFTLATGFANQRGNAVMLLEANSRRRSQRANHRHASG